MNKVRAACACAAAVAMAVLAIGCPKSQVVSPDPVATADASADGPGDAAGDTRPPSDAAVASSEASGALLPAADAATACPSASVPKVLEKIACVDDFERIDHRLMGFSADGTYFGFCISSCDPCPLHCELTSPTRPPVSFTYASYHEVARPQLSEDEIQRKMEALDRPHKRFMTENSFTSVTRQRVLHGPWRYPELVLATRSSVNDHKGTTILEVGASVDGGEPVFPIRLEVGPHPMWTSPLPKETLPAKASAEDRAKALVDWRAQWAMNPAIAAVVDVSPDGKDLGVVAFASGAMWFEDARATRMPVDVFAKRVHAAAAARQP